MCGLLFHWSSFQELFLILMKSSPSISPFMDHAYGGVSKNSFVTRVRKVFSYVFHLKVLWCSSSFRTWGLHSPCLCPSWSGPFLTRPLWFFTCSPACFWLCTPSGQNVSSCLLGTPSSSPVPSWRSEYNGNPFLIVCLFPFLWLFGTKNISLDVLYIALRAIF